MNASHDTLEGARVRDDVEEYRKQVDNLRAVIETAQAEAAEWRLSSVNLWDPSRLVHEWIEKSNVRYWKIDREDESIASLLWYRDGSGREDMLEWVANEKYAWC